MKIFNRKIIIFLAAVLLFFNLAPAAMAQESEFLFDSGKPIRTFGGSSGPISEDPSAASVGNQTGIASGLLTSLQNITEEGFFTSQILAAAIKLLSYATYYISYFIGFIAGVLFFMGGVLLQLGLELNARLINTEIVANGWLITRDFANLGFVLGIIVIAFATMLRLESYGMKKLLTSLIMMAILVNFSLAIVGVLIDATGIITNFFLTKATPGGLGGIQKFAENLASAFQLQKLQEVKDISQLPEIKGAGDFSTAAIGLIASVFFVAMFTILGASVMMAIAGMVLIRYIYLALLIILMPLAWAFSIFPQFKEYGKKWWGSFLEWLLFLPGAMFFFYLSVQMIHNQQDSPNTLQRLTSELQAQTGGVWDSFLIVIKNTFDVFGQMVVILGIMYGGLIAAKSASGFGASSVIGYADNFRKKWQSRIGGAALIPAGAATIVPAEAAKQKLLRTKLAERAASGLARVPGARGLGYGLGQAVADEKERAKKEVDKMVEKKLGNVSNAAKKAAPEGSVIEAAAKVSALAKEGILGEYLDEVEKKSGKRERDKKLERYITAAKKTGKDKELLNAMPHLAEKFGKKTEDVINRMSPKDILGISKESFRKIEVVSALKNKQLESIGKNASPEVKAIVKDTLEKEMDRLTAPGAIFSPQDAQLLPKLQNLDNIVNTPAWQ